MKKWLIFPTLICVMLLSGCAQEFNKVYKSTDYIYKYEYAKECYARGKYTRAITLLQEMVTMMKGSENGFSRVKKTQADNPNSPPLIIE